jgi:hypothetical protein
VDERKSCINTFLDVSEEVNELFKVRLKGSLGNMINPRAVDYLSILSDRELIDREIVRKYKIIRNRFAHGDDIDWAELQKHIDDSSTILVLFYQLIFLIIGYTGNFRDYSRYEYPLRKFEKMLN